ncbi:uncharacterized protein CLAFUR5_00808 [Fulvia fulva]|uniref:Uncharacterized protein n=1 Tax=Passalora fulva TaxID=5499 RepID=A0A9Q8P2Q4_PASFU|nr:uncharacterized protein CLAFUR5_00808 [Fulvia fulva]KAK4636946.1 hypothetical protein CLAFUR0_00807 [Fulvia fulva]UJO10994.1 hypothetical protein CLAFUR5_00808 [Fulvia fulva]
MALPIELALYLAIYFCTLLPLLLVCSLLLPVARRLSNLSVVSAVLDSASDFFRDSVNCGIIGSFPDSPLILAILFDEAIPQGDVTSRKHQKQLKQWRRGLKWEFYV